MKVGIIQLDEWGYTSGRFRAFDHDFGIRTTEAALGRFVSDVLYSLAESGTPSRWYSIEDRGLAATERFALSFDGDELVSGAPSAVLSTLFWSINRGAVESCVDDVLLHAAGAEHNGRALIFPARMESGKSTLVAGLVRAGLRYLTDEAVAIRPASLRIRGLAKPLTIEPGSWAVLADLEPAVPAEVRRYIGSQWHVDVRSIRPDACAEVAAPSLVIVPQYESGATTTLTPLRAPDALMALCENSFNLAAFGQSGLDTLREVVLRSECYELIIGDLEAACELVLDALEREGSLAQEAPTDLAAPRSSIAAAQIDGESVLLDSTTGALHRLDAIGSLVWAACDGSASIGALAADLALLFGTDPRRVHDDVEVFVRRLVELGLLTYAGDATRPSRPGAND